MQLDLDFLGKIFLRPRTRSAPRTRVDHRMVWKDGIEVDVVFRPRARRYLLALQADGIARLVIPRRGTEAEGLRFLERSEAWLLKRLERWGQHGATRQAWIDGSRFLFRGEEVTLRVERDSEGFTLGFAGERFRTHQTLTDYRELVHSFLRRLAEKEFPIRTGELAAAHGITIKRISVRAQKSRWGSCSVRGTISLNWRLIQAPPFVVDYIIVHELMHRKEMNHSKRYWKLVAEAFPDYRTAEKWLKRGGLELR